MLVLALVRLPEVIKGDIPPTRLLQAAGNSWFAVGPVLVFTVANLEPMHAGAALLILALAAQFACDFAISTLRYAIAREADFASQLREAWVVYAIDAGLAGIALIVAGHISARPGEILAFVPLLRGVRP